MVEKLAREFASNWKEVLSRINTDVMTYFLNFELGSDILKKVLQLAVFPTPPFLLHCKVLSQLVLYYKRFEEIHRKCFRISSNHPPTATQEPSAPTASGFVMGKSLVPISTITYEITKKYSTFSYPSCSWERRGVLLIMIYSYILHLQE
jgi:hypothetical protein